MKKLLLSLLIGIVLTFSTAPLFTARAADATTWYNQSFQEWYNKVYDTSNPSEIFGERYTAAQVQWIIYSLGSFILNSIAGPGSTDAIQCFLTNSGDLNTCGSALEKIIPKTLPKSAELINPRTPGQNNSLVSLVFTSNRPLSGISYVKERLQKLNPVTEVHAASVGFGYTALQSIQQMWMASRNFAFALFVIAAIIMAFMVMFRVKISPQVVITVQSAIPKIITALILVTFSYAIAGFLIDLMYVVIGLLSLFLPNFILGSVGAGGFTPAQAFNWMTLGPLSLGIIGGIFIYLLFFLVMLILTLIINLSAVIVGLTVFGIAASSVGGIIMIVILVIILLVVVWHSFKIWWSLIKAFVSVVLLTIVAPLQIAAGIVVPNFGFNAWLKSFISALSTFVVTGLLMFMSYAFLVQAWFAMASDWGKTAFSALFGSSLGGQIPTLSGVSSPAWPPLLGNGNSNAVTAILFVGVSFVLFTLIPKANQIVQAFITGKPFAYGTAFGETFGPVGGLAKTVGSTATGAAVNYGGINIAKRINDIRGADGYVPGGRMDRFMGGIQEALEGLKHKP